MGNDRSRLAPYNAIKPKYADLLFAKRPERVKFDGHRRKRQMCGLRPVCEDLSRGRTLDKDPLARKRLGLQKHEHILAALDLGYPAVRFKNKVAGKTMPVVWAAGPSSEL